MEPGMVAEGQCFPRTMDHLKAVLEIAVEFSVRHFAVHADSRAMRLRDCLPVLEGWMRFSDGAGVYLCVQTYRNTMTTELRFTIGLPELKLGADLSHYVV